MFRALERSGDFRNSRLIVQEGAPRGWETGQQERERERGAKLIILEILGPFSLEEARRGWDTEREGVGATNYRRRFSKDFIEEARRGWDTGRK